jgi:hypothetical protein
MFRIRVFTPPVQNEHGQLQAGGELRLGNQRVGFVVDLSHWTVGDYERQWKEGTARLLHRARPSDAPHLGALAGRRLRLRPGASRRGDRARLSV